MDEQMQQDVQPQANPASTLEQPQQPMIPTQDIAVGQPMNKRIGLWKWVSIAVGIIFTLGFIVLVIW